MSKMFKSGRSAYLDIFIGILWYSEHNIFVQAKDSREESLI